MGKLVRWLPLPQALTAITRRVQTCRRVTAGAHYLVRAGAPDAAVGAGDGGAEVGLTRGAEAAGQDAEAPPRPDGGADQDDLLDLSLPQHAHGHGNPKIRFATSGGTDAERQVVVAHG